MMMTLLDRYLVRTIFLYTAMVMAALLTLVGLFTFLDQAQNDIGVGTYGVTNALFFSALNLPQQAFELMPIGVLLGTLLGLGLLARGSELIVIRASGVSILRTARAIALGGVMLACLSTALAEFIAPPLQKFARQQKLFAKFSDVSLAGAAGAWVKDGDTLISVQERLGNDLFGDVYVYRFAGPQALATVAHADRATVKEGERNWKLERYAETRFGEERVHSTSEPAHPLAVNVDPGFLSLTVKPQQLPSRDLWRQIQNLRANGLDASTYEFAFWSRIARLCAIALMALLAIPFCFGPQRSSGAGARLIIGVLIGVAFFLLQRTMESGAVVFDLNPVILAWLPTALLALLSAVLIARTR